MSSHQIHLEPAPEDSLAFYPGYPIASQHALRQAIAFLQRITEGTEAHNNFALMGRGLFELATSQRASLEVAIPCDLPIAAIQQQRRHSNILIYSQDKKSGTTSDVSITVEGLELHVYSKNAPPSFSNMQPAEAQAMIFVVDEKGKEKVIASASLDFIEKASAATKAAYKASLTPHVARRKGKPLCSVKAMPY